MIRYYQRNGGGGEVRTACICLRIRTSGKSEKLKLSLCLTRHHAKKTYWGVDLQLHVFFYLGTRWR